MTVFPVRTRGILVCALLLSACADQPGGAASDAPAGFVSDCQDKPYFDTVSASDRKTVVKGMTEREREACTRLRGPSGSDGGM